MTYMELLTGTVCNDCKFKVADITNQCPSCGSENIQAIPIEQSGRIHTFTIVYVGFGHMAERAPYALAVVDTEDHIKLTTVIEDVTDFEALKIGDRVRFKKNDEKIGPIFQLA